MLITIVLISFIFIVSTFFLILLTMINKEAYELLKAYIYIRKVSKIGVKRQLVILCTISFLATISYSFLLSVALASMILYEW